MPLGRLTIVRLTLTLLSLMAGACGTIDHLDAVAKETQSRLEAANQELTLLRQQFPGLLETTAQVDVNVRQARMLIQKARQMEAEERFQESQQRRPPQNSNQNPNEYQYPQPSPSAPLMEEADRLLDEAEKGLQEARARLPELAEKARKVQQESSAALSRSREVVADAQSLKQGLDLARSIGGALSGGRIGNSNGGEELMQKFEKMLKERELEDKQRDEERAKEDTVRQKKATETSDGWTFGGAAVAAGGGAAALFGMGYGVYRGVTTMKAKPTLNTVLNNFGIPSVPPTARPGGQPNPQPPGPGGGGGGGSPYPTPFNQVPLPPAMMQMPGWVWNPYYNQWVQDPQQQQQQAVALQVQTGQNPTGMPVQGQTTTPQNPNEWPSRSLSPAPSVEELNLWRAQQTQAQIGGPHGRG